MDIKSNTTRKYKINIMLMLIFYPIISTSSNTKKSKRASQYLGVQKYYHYYFNLEKPFFLQSYYMNINEIKFFSVTLHSILN